MSMNQQGISYVCSCSPGYSGVNCQTCEIIIKYLNIYIYKHRRKLYKLISLKTTLATVARV